MTPTLPTRYAVSDLPFNRGVSYHLGLTAEHLAPAIVLVGDPERVDFIAERFFQSTEMRVSHRGLTTCTGIARDTKQRVTVTTTGMGAPSTEIVLNELAALAEVDTTTLTRISDRAAPLTLIRVGTSGALQRTTTLGTSIISSRAVGVDSTAWFYGNGVTMDPIAVELSRFVDTQLDLALEVGDPTRGKIHAYGALANGEVVAALRDAAQELRVDHAVGATFTASGFFAPQGRDVSRLAPSVPDLDRRIAHDLRFLNMDMETAFVLHFCGALGYRAGAVCVAAANRERDTFATDIGAHVEDAVRVALRALATVCR